METEIPNVPQILEAALQNIDPAVRPILLAALERLAAQRYRSWAAGHPDPPVQAGLLACADREEEIARRVESLHSDAGAIQERLFAENPQFAELNRTLFEGRPLSIQFLMQSQGERAGAAAWGAFAAAGADGAVRDLLLSCSGLEEANAAFLETLL